MKKLFTALKIFFFFTILTGVLYPLVITGIVQILFPFQSNGSLIKKNNVIVGSALIGQKFDTPVYFSSRPSFNSYNPLPSGGSNYGLTNKKLKTLVELRKEHFLLYNFLDSATIIPSEMLFASASGLDPDISANAALLQVNRIVKARKFSSEQHEKVLKLIKSQILFPQDHLFGEQRINVLYLNLSLDTIK